jgi:hypothetical protein
MGTVARSENLCPNSAHPAVIYNLSMRSAKLAHHGGYRVPLYRVQRINHV